MLDFASPLRIYHSAVIKWECHNQILITAKILDEGKKSRVMLYGTRLTLQMHKRLEQVHPSVAFPHTDDPIFVQLVEPPFLCYVPLKGNDPEQSYYFIPFFHKGKLLLQDLGVLNKRKILRYIIQISKSLLKLSHQYDRIHGQLTIWHLYMEKQNNIWVVKLIPPRTSIIRKMEVECNHPYRSTEILNKEGEVQRADLWSLGHITADLLKGKISKNNQKKEIWKSIKIKKFSELIKKMLGSSFQHRITNKQLLTELEEVQFHQLKGIIYTIPLFTQQKENIQQNVDGCQEKRVILDGFLLSLQFNANYSYLRIRLLYKKNLRQYVCARFNRISQLPERVMKRWSSLKSLTLQILSHTRQSMYFLTDGSLSFICRSDELN